MRCEPAFVRERARNLRGSRAARWGRRAARAMASRASTLGTHTSGDVQLLHATRGCAPSALCTRRSRDFFPLRNRPLPSRHPPNLAAPEPPPPLPLRGSADLLPAVVAPPFDRAPSSPHCLSAHRHADCGPSRRRRPRHHHLRRSHRPCRSRCARLRRPRPRRAPAYRDFPCRPPSPVGRCPSSIFR